jgi:hypothetical protein
MSMTAQSPIWTTFNKREIPVVELDHQHLSNIYWFHLLIHKEKLDWAMDEIRTRFNGQLLEYKPHIDYAHELENLESAGFLHWKNINTGDQIRIGEICYEGQSIGIVWKLLS